MYFKLTMNNQSIFYKNINMVVKIFQKAYRTVGGHDSRNWTFKHSKFKVFARSLNQQIIKETEKKLFRI